MPALNLSPAERKHLRGQAHHLDPVVIVGAEGLSAALLKEADAALKAHGLIKVRMFSDQREQREQALRQLSETLHAAAVLKEADAALKAHGLIKVRMFSDQRDERALALAQLAQALDAAPVQHIGKLLVLWRPIPAAPKPAAEPRGAAPRVVKILKFSKSGNHRPQIKKIKVYGNQRVTAGGEIKRAKPRTISVKKKAV